MKFIADGYTHEFNERTGMWDCKEGSEVQLPSLSTVDIIMWIVTHATEMPYYDRETIKKYLETNVK